ncbi:DUF1365 domain-containing protein [Spongisporangium articulatum]|uniref:DUF1365 domain-containing protein n=1 Tax=Spongisporangium articulatum TaxID=3362603 RepID=A0ABW8AP81_9ACTN
MNPFDPQPAALYSVEIAHARTAPLRNVFRYRSYLWLVDLDALPVLPRALRPLARFRAADHFEGAGTTIRARLDAYLATQGVDLRGGRVLMAASARVLGYVFNPLSVFWCHDPSGDLVCVVAEVHNTYGQCHPYLVRTDARGGAETPKAFYVSPFEPVEGTYRMSLPEPGETLELVVTLHRPSPPDGGPPAPPFVATVRGRRRPATAGTLLALAVRSPLAPLVGALRIRRQGIALWLRGLPVVPRPGTTRPDPSAERQEAVR